MAKTKFQLPKDGLVEPEGRTGSESLIDDTDVQGHGLPITAPPSFGNRVPGHGGENIPSPVDDEDDVEGHGRPRF